MHRTRALLLAVLLAGLGSALWAPAASAHSGRDTYVYLDILEDHIEGEVHYPIDALSTVTGLDLPDGSRGTRAEFNAQGDAVRAYTADHLSFADESGTTDWPVTVEGDFRFIEEGTGNYVVVPFVVDAAVDSVPQRFTVRFDGIVHELTDKRALLLIARDWEGGRFNNDNRPFGTFSASEPSLVVDRDASFWTGFRAVIGLGTQHIRIGTDHILFVLALVLPAVLVFTRREGWRSVPTFGAGLWRVTKIATMFTLAHSVTLSLGGLDLIHLPPRPVETLIALSIAAAAIHNFYPVFANREWLIAFGFGLFHGLGFASLLDDLGLDGGNRVWSLLGFNIGIELGQLVIIFLLFPLLFFLRRTLAYPFVFYGGSALLAVVATGWAVERFFRLDDAVSPIIEPILEWPRAAFVTVALGVLAAGYNRWAAANGRLRDLDDVMPAPRFLPLPGGAPAPAQPPSSAAPPPGEEELEPA